MFSETVITPKNQIITEVVTRPYSHSVWQSASALERDVCVEPIDKQVSRGKFIHTMYTQDGVYILIHITL